MACILVSPLVSTNIPTAGALIPIFKDESGNALSSLKIQYVPVESSPYTFRFSAIDEDSVPPSFPSVTVASLPPGATLQSSSLSIPGNWELSWDTSDFANNDIFTYQSFVVTFVATDDEGEIAELSIPFLLFKGEAIGPTIALDSDTYLAGDTAYLTIFDVRADRDGINSGTGTDLGRINFQLGDQARELGEVGADDDPAVRSGTFRGSFVVSTPLAVSYQTDYSGLMQSDVVEVSSTGIKFEKKHYTTGTQAKIIAATATGNQPTGLTVNGASLTNPWSGGGGRFETAIILNSLGENTISATIDGVSYSAVTLAENVSAEIVNASQVAVSSLYSNETATVSVTDHRMNADRMKAELIQGAVQIFSDQDPATVISIDLLETGVDTGVFAGNHLVGFTTGEPDIDRKILNIDPMPGKSTSLQLNYAAGSLSDSDSIEVITSSLPQIDEGIGDSSGIPVAASPIVSMTNLNCASYGGDAERDGICDGWEAPAKTYLTIPYGGSNHVFTYACDPTCPHSSNDDILLEIDTLNGQGPSSNVLPDIKTLFDQRGYKLHYRINENIAITDGLLNVWDDPTGDVNCGTLDSFKEIKKMYFGEGSTERLTTDTDACDTASVNDKGAAKKQVWHYCLYGKTARQQWSGGPVGTSGISEEIGNDCAVTLGDFSPVDQDKEKGTLMHELGHMFGLRHGGGVNSITANPLTWIADSNANCKPNYISPMSYSHQFPNALGTVTLDNWTPSYSNYALTHYDANSPLNSPGVQLNEPDGPNPNTGTIDVAWVTSAGGAPNNKAIASGASGSADDVDWNGGGIGGLVWNNNVNNFGFRDCDTTTSTNAPNGVIRGFRDWNKLVLEMRVHGASNWNIPGQFIESNELNDTIWKEIVVGGVKVLNNKVQLLNSSVFSSPQNANTTKASIEEDLIYTPCDPGELVCFFSVAQNVQKDEIRDALEGLSYVSSLYDGDVGGDPNDDVIKDPEARAELFASTQGNFRTLVMELLEKDDRAFGMAWSNYNDVYAVIMAESPTINATDGRFFVHEKNLSDPGQNTITFTVKGEGPLGLELDKALVDHEMDKENTKILVDGNPIDPDDVDFADSAKSRFFGSRIDFEVTSANGGDEVHEIVIMGATVIPEFPATSVLILALMIVAIIVITTVAAQGRNRFMSSLAGR
jgi:hypothetical protein